MNKLKFTNEHIADIRKSISENKQDNKNEVWKNKNISDLKRNIKQHYRLTKNCCAYCLKSFQNEHNMNIDIEHILPKSKFARHTFTIKNLTIACKRCNLIIKGSKIDFLENNFNWKKPFQSKFYKFTHPILDKKNNLKLYSVNISNCLSIIKYDIMNNSKKATYSYEYFRLKEVEVLSIDSAQGIKELIDFIPEIINRANI